MKITDYHHLEFLPVSVLIKKGAPNRASLNNWWFGRSIPVSRMGLEEAVFKMNIPNKNQLLIKSFGLSLSDQYWMNPEGSLSWSDINFFENDFSEDVGHILFGEPLEGETLNLVSPDNTSDGWLKKRWKIIDGKRCLIKGGSRPYMQEPLNEVFASLVSERLNTYDYVKYDLMMENSEPYSICKNFVTADTEFIPAYQIYQTIKKENHVSVYEHFLHCSENLGIRGMEEYLNHMLTLDYIIANTDRHMNNFGVIRDVNTLEYKGAAPIFDSGTSLWHDIQEEDIHLLKDNKSKPFRSTHSRQIELVTSYKDFDLSKLKGIEEEFNEILKKSPVIKEKRRNILCRSVQMRIARGGEKCVHSF